MKKLVFTALPFVLFVSIIFIGKRFRKELNPNNLQNEECPKNFGEAIRIVISGFIDFFSEEEEVK